MDETLPGRLLTTQHRKIDQGVSDVMEGTGDLETLRRTMELLRLHLYVEEEFLFPSLAGNHLEMPIYIMQHEHGQIWSFLERLSDACRQEEAPTDAVREDCRKVLKLWKLHDPKEEDLMYALADRQAAADPRGTLAADIKAARVPDGWLCMAKREGFAPPPGAPPWEPAPEPK